MPTELSNVEFIFLCGIMTVLTGAIAACIKWGVDTLAAELRELSTSIGDLRKELHKLADRVLRLEEWRVAVGQRRHDDPPDGPAPIRWSPND